MLLGVCGGASSALEGDTPNTAQNALETSGERAPVLPGPRGQPGRTAPGGGDAAHALCAPAPWQRAGRAGPLAGRGNRALHAGRSAS